MTAPDPTPAPEMEAEFVRLVIECETAAAVWSESARHFAARKALHRWHREQVERAVREAVEKYRRRERTTPKGGPNA